MATKTTQAVTDCTRTAIVAAIMNTHPLADFEEYANASDAAATVVGDRL